MWSAKSSCAVLFLQHLQCQCRLFQDIWPNLPIILLLPLMMTCLINKLNAIVSCACLAIVYMYVIKLAYTICNIMSQNGQYFLYSWASIVYCSNPPICYNRHYMLSVAEQSVGVVFLTYYSNNSALSAYSKIVRWKLVVLHVQAGWSELHDRAYPMHLSYPNAKL